MPRVIIINHAYAARENRKSLVALSRELDVLALAPDRVPSGSLGLSTSRSDPLAAGEPVVLKPARYLRQKLLLAPFARELSSFGPDVIHVESAPWIPITWETLAMARSAAPQAKFVLTLRKNTYVHGLPPVEWAKSALRFLVDRKVDAYVAESDMAVQLWERLFGLERRRAHICLQLGVDTDLFAPDPGARPSAKLKIGYVGRLEPHKGVPELVAAVEELSATAPVKLRLLGAGSLKADLHRKASGVDWLEVFGAVEHRDVAPFLQGCDVFALPSRNLPDHQEHDGHALMEAMACGLPAVVTRSGILPEHATDETAFFVRERRADDIVGALRATADPARRRAMGALARERAVALFGLSALARKRRAIYEEVLC